MANALAEATSPYLLQHRDNPVDWRPWGPEALAEAQFTLTLEDEKHLLLLAVRVERALRHARRQLGEVVAQLAGADARTPLVATDPERKRTNGEQNKRAGTVPDRKSVV
mgnify:CR=1 FL=1